MKRVEIFKHNIGLVFKKGNFLEVLTAGSHWLWLDKQVKIYDKTKPFAAPCELDILLQNPILERELLVIEVADNEVVLVFKNGNFSQVLRPGRHAFWRSVIDYKFQVVDLNELEIDEKVSKKLLARPELYPYVRKYMVETYEEGLLVVDGKYYQKLSAGTYYFWKNEQNINVLKADMRAQQMEVSGQEILTKDKAALRINFYLQYKIVDIEKALLENKEVSKQLYLLMQLAIREYVGGLTLDELLAKKEAIRDFVLEAVAEKVADLGCQMLACGIRDIILPGDVKEIMNQVLMAEKKAKANTIMRREETASTRSLLNTAKLMEENAMLFKLKEMEYVEKIAEKINSISVSGGGQLVEQLKEIFVAK